jgi:hypothetical protein
MFNCEVTTVGFFFNAARFPIRPQLAWVPGVHVCVRVAVEAKDGETERYADAGYQQEHLKNKIIGNIIEYVCI